MNFARKKERLTSFFYRKAGVPLGFDQSLITLYHYNLVLSSSFWFLFTVAIGRIKDVF